MHLFAMKIIPPMYRISTPGYPIFSLFQSDIGRDDKVITNFHIGKGRLCFAAEAIGGFPSAYMRNVILHTNRELSFWL